jgi:hypothetical protein
MRRMRASTARVLAHGVWLATLVIWIVAQILLFAIAPSDAIPMALLGLPMATYASVGALVARSSPRNLIAWLFSSVALALALWMFGSACARFGLGGALGIGDLPGAAAAAWTGAVALIAVLPIALPVFLLIFPDCHLRSRHVTIGLREDEGRLVFEVHDDGVGFDPAGSGYGSGLQGMADRVEALGGRLSIDSSPGQGTTLTGDVPIPAGTPR